MIPPEAELTDRPEEIPAWEDMPDDLKPVLARQMEVYAGFLEHTDHHVGRLIDALADLEVLDDTLDLLHRRRQRRIRGGNPAGHVQRDDPAQRRGRDRDDRVHGVANRRVRHDRGQQPLRGRLGARDGHALPVDQAGGLALGRHPQRHGRALAERLHRSRRGARAVQPRDRRGGDGARRGRPARADVRPRRAADAAARQEHGPDLRRPGRARAPRDAVLRDVRQPRHLPQGLDRGHSPQHPVARRRDARLSTPTSGSSTRPTTGRRPTTWRRSSPRSSPSSSACS